MQNHTGEGSEARNLRFGGTATGALLLIATTLVAVSGTYAQERSKRESVEFAACTSFENVEAFVMSFKDAVRERSCFKVAALTRFPLRINFLRSAKRSRSIWNRTALCRYFPVIFNETMTEAVLKQNILDMAVGWRGLMFGHGYIWIQPLYVDPDATDPDDPTELRFTAANVIERPPKK